LYLFSLPCHFGGGEFFREKNKEEIINNGTRDALDDAFTIQKGCAVIPHTLLYFTFVSIVLSSSAL
jgi:hypothetical protein